MFASIKNRQQGTESTKQWILNYMYVMISDLCYETDENCPCEKILYHYMTSRQFTQCKVNFCRWLSLFNNNLLKILFHIGVLVFKLLLNSQVWIFFFWCGWYNPNTKTVHGVGGYNSDLQNSTRNHSVDHRTWFTWAEDKHNYRTRAGSCTNYNDYTSQASEY